jgi:hypothetical protein
MDPKKYTINGKGYIQKPLVLGQMDQMMNILEGVKLTALTPLAIIQALGGRLPMAAAIVLIPEGMKIRDKDLTAIEDEFAENLELETALEVAADFLSFNPLSSISSKSKMLINGIWEMLPKIWKKAGLKSS